MTYLLATITILALTLAWSLRNLLAKSVALNFALAELVREEQARSVAIETDSFADGWDACEEERQQQDDPPLAIEVECGCARCRLERFAVN